MSGYINVSSYTGTIGSLTVVNNLSVGGAISAGTFSNIGVTGPTGASVYASTGSFIVGNGLSWTGVGNFGTNTNNTVSIGVSAGVSAGQYAIAVGEQAGNSGQQANQISIGVNSGYNSAATGSICIGYNAGQQLPGQNSICIGTQSGFSSLGANAIAIGLSASYHTGAAGTININAGGNAIDAITTNACYITPIRNANSVAVGCLAYNTLTSEIVNVLLGKAEYSNNGTQSINNNSTTSIIFPNLQYNTFGSALSIAGTNNTTFGNNLSGKIYVFVSFKLFWPAIITLGETVGEVQINGTSNLYGYSVTQNSTVSTQTQTNIGSVVLMLNPGDTFIVSGYQINSGSSAVTTSQNSVYANYVQIAQIA